MTPREIIDASKSIGITIGAESGRLKLEGDLNRLTDDLREAIRRDAVGLIITLTGRLMTHPRLCYYVKRGDGVETPHGPATVLQVFADRITVRARGEKKARFYAPEEIMLTPDSQPAT